MVNLVSAYDDFGPMSDATGLKCLDASLTQQQFKDESDINTIVDTFMRTGHLPTPVSLPQYYDATNDVFDYKAAMNFVRQADEAFMTMDAKVRARFHNSPHEFLEFFSDPANEAEAIRLGLAVPKPTSAAAPAAAEATPSKAEGS